MSFSNIYISTCVQLHNLHQLYYIGKQKKKETYTNKQPTHNSMFPPFNLSIFTLKRVKEEQEVQFTQFSIKLKHKK